MRPSNWVAPVLAIAGVLLVSACTAPGGKPGCPPPGPWPQPPGCEGGPAVPGTGAPATSTGAPTATGVAAAPSPPGSRDEAACFPSSCAQIGDSLKRQICEDRRAGRQADWKTVDCSTWKPIACQRLCENETIQRYPPSDVEIHGRDFYSNPDDLPMVGTIYSFGPSLATDLYWIKLPKSRGAKVLSGVSLWNEDAWKNLENLPAELKGAYVKGFDGEPLYSQGVVYLNILDPAWQAWAKGKVREHVDAGTDGFAFDEHWGTAEAVKDGIGPFDEYALAGFREYLKRTYTTAQLREKGVQDIDAFNYRDFLVRGGYRESYAGKDRAKVPFMDDYYVYLLRASSDAISGLIDYAKAYGREKGRTLLFAANADPLYHFKEFPFYDKLDFYVFEHEWFPAWRREGGNRPFDAGAPVGAQLHYARVRGQSAAVMYGIYDGAFLNRTGQRSGTILLQHEFAEAYANLGYYMYFDLVNYLNMTFVGDRSLLRPYYGFVRAHPEAFNNLATRADVAVLLPPTVFISETGGADGAQAFSFLLGGANIPHDVVDLDKISGYRVVLAGGSTWSDADLDKLLAFVRSGGTVIATHDKFASKDENYKDVDRPSLRELKTGGEHTLGSGKFVFFTDYLWWKIWAQRDRAATAKILDTVRSANVAANTAPEKVQLLPYTGPDGRLAVHILNYDFTGGDFVNKTNFEVKVRLPPGVSTSGKALTLSSPDFKGNATLPFKEEGNTLSFTVPSLYIWDVAVMR